MVVFLWLTVEENRNFILAGANREFSALFLAVAK
jgi:hypothetical protein